VHHGGIDTGIEGKAMDEQGMDQQAMSHIERLVADEHRLFAQGTLSDADSRRLTAIQVELDRYWDLLRRRRSAERSGGDPDQVGLRDEGTVENYLQ
jgi:hypothetical protein